MSISDKCKSKRFFYGFSCSYIFLLFLFSIFSVIFSQESKSKYNEGNKTRIAICGKDFYIDKKFVSHSYNGRGGAWLYGNFAYKNKIWFGLDQSRIDIPKYIDRPLIKLVEDCGSSLIWPLSIENKKFNKEEKNRENIYNFDAYKNCCSSYVFGSGDNGLYRGVINGKSNKLDNLFQTFWLDSKSNDVFGVELYVKLKNGGLVIVFWPEKEILLPDDLLNLYRSFVGLCDERIVEIVE